MSRVIGIVSGKGGTGKTMVATNLALSLRQMNKEVTLIDADTTAANVGLRLGQYSFENEIQDVLEGKVKPKEAVYELDSGLKLMPSSISYEEVLIDNKGLKRILRSMRGTIIVDSPPGMCEDALSVMRACDEVLIVANPEIPTITNVLKLIKIAKDIGKDVVGIVLNRVEGKKYELTPSEVEIMCEAPVLAKVPEDINVKKSLFETQPLLTYDPISPSSVEIRKLASKLLDKQYKPPKLLFFKRLMNFIPGVKYEA